MNKGSIYALICTILAAVSWNTAGNARQSGRLLSERNQDFTSGWSFIHGDSEEYSSPGFDDSNWRVLDLPHDWAIEGDFSKDNPSTAGGGALPGGTGWYRKSFFVDTADKGMMFYIDFDGVYMNSTVYINGHELGTRPYGYISFRYDITPYLEYGETNTIAVRVDNSDQPNSRWYSGCGIYRNVWLSKTSPVHVGHWGTYITSEMTEDGSAVVKVKTSVENSSENEAGIKLSTVLYGPDMKQAGKKNFAGLVVPAGENRETEQSIKVSNPALWSIDEPQMYTAVTEIIKDGRTVDRYETPFGIRYFRFDPEKGFYLNGKHLKINGVCLHHDLGCLGAAVNGRAIERQLEILKDMGCNGIRTAHNPPAPELLDLCDRMGFIVMDEAFDMWRKGKTANDYSRFFDKWHEKDLEDMILRDRNHPSIFIWSIGNEVLEQWSDASADTLSLEEANLILNFGHSKEQLAKEGEMSVNSMLTRKLAEIVRGLDKTRPVTAGCQEASPDNHLFRSGALDIIGFNYQYDHLDSVLDNFPGMPFMITESVSGLATRGYYRMPSDSLFIWPQGWPFYDPSMSCSSYDNCHVPWGSSHEESLRQVRNNDYISGQYVWTGFDYLGEPTPFDWPARSSYFGIIDLAGFPKDIYYMYQSEWCPEKQVLHLFPHWNWTPGQTVDVWACYNNADEVELFCNGKSMGTRSKGKDGSHVCWRVVFEPGTIKAVARKNGKTVQETERSTAGAPARIRLRPDRSIIQADGDDLCFITVEILDKNGTLCPLADNKVTFSISGSGTIAGVDNGSQTSMEKFKATERNAFYGKCLAVVRNSGKPGKITFSASSPGLESAGITIECR